MNINYYYSLDCYMHMLYTPYKSEIDQSEKIKASYHFLPLP